MRFVNTVELKNKLNAVLSEVGRGEAVVVTRHGKPTATLVSTNEDELDRMLFERSAVVREAVLEGLRDLGAGRAISARDYAARRFGRKFAAPPKRV
jgi:prevent-host-death family protein